MDLDIQDEKGNEIEMENSAGGCSSASAHMEASNGGDSVGKKRFSFRRPLDSALDHVFGSSRD